MELKERNPKALEAALHAIAESEANHAKKAIAAGAAGVFLAIANAQDGLMTQADYRKFSEPFDRMVLKGGGGRAVECAPPARGQGLPGCVHEGVAGGGDQLLGARHQSERGRDAEEVRGRADGRPGRGELPQAPGRRIARPVEERGERGGTPIHPVAGMFGAQRQHRRELMRLVTLL